MLRRSAKSAVETSTVDEAALPNSERLLWSGALLGFSPSPAVRFRRLMRRAAPHRVQTPQLARGGVVYPEQGACAGPVNNPVNEPVGAGEAFRSRHNSIAV